MVLLRRSRTCLRLIKMRTRQCKRCGAQFQSDKPYTCLCTACRKKSKQDSVIRSRTCRQCGREFAGGPRAWYCPECRDIRQKEADARRAKNGTNRPLGSIDHCEICGGEYIVNAARQRYCKGCAAEAIRRNVNPHKAEYAKDHMERLKEQQKELRKDRTVCLVCGAVFTSDTATVTCSDACAAELRKLRQRESDYRSGRRKSDPKNYPILSDRPKSGIPGVTWLRGKWQAVYNKKYIGVFPTIEEAESAIKKFKGEIQNDK